MPLVFILIINQHCVSCETETVSLKSLRLSQLLNIHKILAIWYRVRYRSVKQAVLRVSSTFKQFLKLCDLNRLLCFTHSRAGWKRTRVFKLMGLGNTVLILWISGILIVPCFPLSHSTSYHTSFLVLNFPSHSLFPYTQYIFFLLVYKHTQQDIFLPVYFPVRILFYVYVYIYVYPNLADILYISFSVSHCRTFVDGFPLIQ